MASVQMLFAQETIFCILKYRKSCFCQIAPLQIASIQVRTTQVLTGLSGTPKPSENSTSTSKVLPCQIRIPRLCLHQVRSAQVGRLQIRVHKVRLAHIGSNNVFTPHIGPKPFVFD